MYQNSEAETTTHSKASVSAALGSRGGAEMPKSMETAIRYRSQYVRNRKVGPGSWQRLRPDAGFFSALRKSPNVPTSFDEVYCRPQVLNQSYISP